MKPLLGEVSLKPLLRLSPLQPGESLPSLLTRLAILNYYDSPLILQRLAQARWPDRLDCASRVSTFQRLAALTSISVTDLFAASDHAIVTTQLLSDFLDWQPPDLTKGIPYWTLSPVRGSVHATQASRFCPQCLNDGAFHRLAWRPVAMSVCLVHDCLLAKACPQCNSPVPIQDIVLLRCTHCHFDLRQVVTPSIRNDIWGRTAQETLWAGLSGHPIIDPGLGWPKCSPPVLCNLAEGMARAMLVFPERFPPHPFAPTSSLKVHYSANTLYHLRPAEIYWAYTFALKWMVGWPEGFREFLHYCAPRSDSTLESGLGFFYSSWIRKQWNKAQFRFVWEAFDMFRSDRAWFIAAQYKQDVPFEHAYAYANLKEAAQILQTPESVVHRLAQINLIHELGRSFETFYLRRDLQAVKDRWSELLSLEQAADWLGVAPEIVLSLAKEQILKGALCPEQNALFFTRNAVAELLELANSRTGGLNRNRLISLAEAARQLDCIHLNEARLLKLVLSQNLPAWRSPLQHNDWGVGEISFTQKDLDAVLKEVALSRNWHSAENISAQMGVEESVFLGWIERGLLTPFIVYNGQPYLKAREIENFSTDYIFGPEAQKLLNISWRRLLGYIRRGKLPLASGPEMDESPRYLLPRKKVEQLARHLQKRMV